MQLCIREWEISWDELKIGDSIGRGRFGTVYKGSWHGDVAVRLLNMDHYHENDQTLETFTLQEVLRR